MMRIGIVMSHPFHSSLGTTVRVMELAYSLSKRGIEVYIFSPFEISRSLGELIHIRRVSTDASKFGFSDVVYNIFRSMFNNAFLGRKLAFKEFTLNTSINVLADGLINSLRGVALDAIQGEQEIASLACLRIGKKLGIPVVADLHNIWAEEAVASGIIERNDHQFKTLQKFENEIINEADMIVVVSEEMKKYIKNENVSSENRVVVVPNGSRVKVQKAEYNDKPSKVVYAGQLAYREHVDLYLRSMSRVAKGFPSVKFYLVGKGENEKSLKRFASNFTVKPEFKWFHPVNEKDEFFNFLSSCHVGVLPSTNDIARQMGYPLKLFDYLSVGLPVVANDIGAWTRIISENRVGVLTKDDPQSFADGILEFLKDPTLLHACGERGINLIKTKFNWDFSAEILLNLYKAIEQKS